MRLKIKAQPTDELSIDASVWFDRARYGGLPLADDAGNRNVGAPEPQERDYNAYNFKIGYDFPSFTITSATSSLDYTHRFRVGAANLLSTDWISDNKVFAQELNVVSTHEGPWRWSLGGIYRDASELGFLIFPSPPAAPGTQPNDSTLFSESFAVFGELTYALIEDQLELTGGLRYFENTLARIVRSNRTVPAPFSPPFEDKADFSKWTPRVILNWRPGNQLMFYASYGQGYRSGVIQNFAAVEAARLQGFVIPHADPDTLTNYEIGAKGSLFDGLVEFDAALYYMDWKDSQQALNVELPGGGGTNGMLNAESFRGVGVDAGLTVKPVEGLELGANLSWNGLKAQADILSGGVVLFAKGDRPNLSAERTVGGSASYRFPLGGSGFTGRLSGSANYSSELVYKSLVSGRVLASESDPAWIGRAGFTVDAPEHWSLSVYAAENIGDANPALGALGVQNPNNRGRIRPRTIGLQLEYKF